MALEQSVHRDTKTKKRIVGFSLRPGALTRWFLTAHERAALTIATKQIAGLRESEEITEDHKHKNMGAKRLFRDEQDVQEIINIILDDVSNLFLPDQLNTLTSLQVSLLRLRYRRT